MVQRAKQSLTTRRSYCTALLVLPFTFRLSTPALNGAAVVNGKDIGT
jgi:hypothetical protein